VLKELKRLNDCYEKLDEKIDKINNRLTLAQIKIAGLGAMVSLVVTIVVLIVASFIRK
jgi:hypothetical protein